MLINRFQILSVLVCYLLLTLGGFPLLGSDVGAQTSHFCILERVLQVLILLQTVFLVIGFWPLFTSCDWNLILISQSTHSLWLVILGVGHDLIAHLQATHVRHTSLIHVRILAFELLLLVKVATATRSKLLRSSWDLARVDRNAHTSHLLLLLDKQHLLLHQLQLLLELLLILVHVVHHVHWVCIIVVLHWIALHVERVQGGSLLRDEPVRGPVPAHSLLVHHREPMTWSGNLILTHVSHLSSVVAGRLVWYLQVRATIVVGAVLFGTYQSHRTLSVCWRQGRRVICALLLKIHLIRRVRLLKMVWTHDLFRDVLQIIVPFFFTRFSEHLDVCWPLARRFLHVQNFCRLLHRRRYAGLIRLISSLIHLIDERHPSALVVWISGSASRFHIWGVRNAGTVLILAKTSEWVLSIQRTWCLIDITVLEIILSNRRLIRRRTTISLHPHGDLHRFVIKWKFIALLLYRRRLCKLLAALSDFFSHIPSTICINRFLSALLCTHI